MAAAFTRPNGLAIRVEKNDDLATRLAKGNVALSNAFHRGLFTIGFIRAEKPGRATVVRSAVNPNGRDLESGTIEVFSKEKNLSVIEAHRRAFDLPESPILERFVDLVRDSEGATTEASCKLEAGERHSARFNLFYHRDSKPAYAAVRRYLNALELDLALVDEFIASDLDFERITKVVTGIDWRPNDPRASRFKLWFMLNGYPEKVARAIELQRDERARPLIMHDEFLVGFDLHPGGPTRVKLYPDLRPEELTDPRVTAAFSPAVRDAMAECRRVHVYFPGPNAPRVIQFHPSDPDAFVARYLALELATPVHWRYRGERMLDMVVSFRDAALGNSKIRDFALYYMPAEKQGG
jgi:LynF/TruF/PatF family peptide O-prenyltransferase